MPMRQYWNAIEPSVYLTLFSWLAPFKEGRYLLRQFATQVDPKYAHPTYLGHVVLTPVLKIVEHLSDICFLEEILVPNANKVIRNNKLRHQITFYIAQQYLKSLILDTAIREEEDEDVTEDVELQGENIAKRGGVTEILLNLPREYQRWNKCYNDEESGSINFQYVNNGKDTENVMPRPMNVQCKIHDSFKQCILQKTQRRKGKVVKTTDTTKLELRLHETWDPLYIARGILTKKFIIKEEDWNNDKPVIFDGGKTKIGVARGSTVTEKRVREEVNYAEDEDEEDETDQQYQDSTEDNGRTARAPTANNKAKKRRIENTGIQKKPKNDTAQTKTELIDIVAERASQHIPPKMYEAFQTEEMCEDLVNDIMTYYNER
jgi:hypothetical protein